MRSIGRAGRTWRSGRSYLAYRTSRGIACKAAALDAAGRCRRVPDEILQRLKQHLSPPQIVELACVVAFWKFYNTVHDSLHIPVESQLLEDTGYVDLAA